MEPTLSIAVERCNLDLERFLELWPHLTSRDLLQILEASQGKNVGLFVYRSADAPAAIEVLVDHDAARAAVDVGSGVRWGSCAADAPGYRISLDDRSGDWVLTGTEAGTVARWEPQS
jgi:hypothetical protein